VSTPQPQTNPVDFAFLKAQTFEDAALQRELAQLFLDQAARLLDRLPSLDPRAQGDAAHLLKGSARGIGAVAVAAAAERYENAPAAGRPERLAELRVAVEAAHEALTRYLATIG
jgi:HPt (histidine-containing phosphotransfer) domain-containing protein